jgi:Fur family ferric uptake transcriptional regulator
MEKKAARSVLQKVGFKATPGRVALLEVLYQAERPLSAEALIKKIKSDVDRATIYRSLKAFQKAGLVRQVYLHTDRAYYESVPKTEHHHVVCTECRAVRDIEGCGFHVTVQSILSAVKDFVAIQEHSFEVFGICKTCASRL